MRLVRLSILCLFSFVGINSSFANNQYSIIPPAIDAHSYVLMDYNSGAILASFNENKRLHPASLNKLMTSYVVEEAIKNGLVKNTDIVRISKDAWAKNFPGSSLMFLEPGQKVMVGDLKKGLIVVSGNDAAVALSEYVAGSQHAFVEQMNKYAEKLGLKNTHFTNVHGLDEDDQYSSAYDLAILAKHIIHDQPEDYKLYSEKEFQYNIKSPQRNRNGLLWDTSLNVDGLKTGHTDQAGYHLVASAYNANTRLIAVVLGTPSPKQREQDVKRLLQWGFVNFETIEPIVKGKAVTEQDVYYGNVDKVELGALSDQFITIPKDKASSLKARFELNRKYLQAPLKKGEIVGKVVYQLDDKEIAQNDLQVMQDVEEGGIFSRFIDWLTLLFKKFFD